MTGNPWIDAIGAGVISTLAGLFTKKMLTTKTKREFLTVGGQTYQEALDEAKPLAESEGWIPLAPPERDENKGGRDFCLWCFEETPMQDEDRICECGGEIYRDRYEFETWSIKLYRDIPA